MRELHLTDPAKIKAATTYNSAADHFDDGPLAFWDRYGRRTVGRLDLKPGSSVLDVGCGTGASALPAAEVVGPNGTVLGVDLAEKMLRQARAKAAQRHLQQVEFRLADMTDLGFPDQHFEVIISVFSLFFVPDMQALIRDLWRMVKPSGQLAITTWGHSLQDWWTIVLGSGLRGTVDAMDAATAQRIQDQTVSWVRDNAVSSIQTNVIYALATKR